MSTTVDERVVSMQFDNKQFEGGVQETLGTLDRLKQRLNLFGATKGLENVDAAARNVNLGPLSSAVENVGLKFSALQVTAATVLHNIVNTAVDAGKRIVSALTIDPIKTGFSEYELKMGSIQTIMASTGESLETVNKYLDELNQYSDQTIYSFSDMTSNIGKFTNAGVKLEDAVAAIKGVSNVAAVSGANANEASRSMYNFAQALSSGYVKLIDWKSIENANMATVEFKNQLLETAAAKGILTKTSDGMYETESGTEISATKKFNETLQEQWMTSEVLIETLKKYGDETTDIGEKAIRAATEVKTASQLFDTLKESAQSGWAQTWEIIFGDFNEGKNLWTKLSDIVGGMLDKAADARNTLLQGWDAGGGRTAMLKSFKNIWESILNIINPIKEAFREIFPPTTAKQLISITENIRDFTAKLKVVTEKIGPSLKSTFKGIFSVFSIGVTIIKELAKGIGKLFGNTGDLLVVVTDATGFIGDMLTKFSDGVKKTGFFSKVIGGLTKGLQFLIDKIKDVFKFLSQKIVAPGFESLGKIFEGLKDILSTVGKGLMKVIDFLVEGLGSALTGGSMKSILDLINGGIITTIIIKIKDLVGGISEVSESIGDIFDSLVKSMKAVKNKINSETLMNIAKSILMLGAGLLLIAMIDEKKLETSLMAMTVLFGELMGSLALFKKINPTGLTSAMSLMTSMSVSILILALALKAIGDIEPTNLLAGVVAIAALLAMMTAITKLLSSNSGKLVKGTGTLIAMAIAVKILTSACEDLSALSWEGLAKGLIGVITLLVSVAVFLNSLPGGATKVSTSFITLSLGLLAMAGAMVILSKLSWENVAKGLVALGGAMVILAVGLNVMQGTTGGSFALLLASIAIGVLTASLLAFNKIDWESIGKGFTVVAGLLVLLGVLGAVVGHVPVILAGMLGLVAVLALTGGAMIIIGAGIAAIATAFKILSFEEIALGLMAVGGALLVFTIASLASVALAPGLLLLSAALIALGAGLIVIATAFTIASFGDIALGLMAVGGALAVFAIASLAAVALAPGIMILAVAIAVLGAGLLAIGAGLVLAGMGISALATAFASGSVAIIKGIADIIMTIVGLAPAIAKAIGEVIGILLTILPTYIPILVDFVFNLIGQLLNKLVEYTPKIVKAVFDILLAVLDGLAKGLPLVVEAAVNLVVNLLAGLAEQIPRIIQAGVELIVALVQGIADSVSYVINAAIDIVIAFIAGIGESLSRVVQAGWDLIVNFIDGMAESIETNMPRLRAAVNRLFKAIITEGTKTLSSGISNIKEVGGNLIDGLKSGITSKLSNLWNNVKSGFQSFKDKFCDFFGIKSPSKVFKEYGEFMDEGLVVGLNHYSNKVADSAEGVGKDAIKSMTGAISGVADMVNSDIDSQPTIRPVLDLSDIRNGANQINGMFGMTPAVGVMSNIGSISSMMNKRQNGANADVISALKDLGSKLSGTSGNTYNINGVTYDDGSNIAEAIQTIIRAANIARRT
jgi:phage-related protein